MFDKGLMEINKEDVNYKRVNAILKHLGPFSYGTPHISDEAKNREMRSIKVLENGAKYEGEWLKGSQIKDGRGI
jgi:hypothetical protein